MGISFDLHLLLIFQKCTLLSAINLVLAIWSLCTRLFKEHRGMCLGQASAEVKTSCKLLNALKNLSLGLMCLYSCS